MQRPTKQVSTHNVRVGCQGRIGLDYETGCFNSKWFFCSSSSITLNPRAKLSPLPKHLQTPNKGFASNRVYGQLVVQPIFLSVC